MAAPLDSHRSLLLRHLAACEARPEPGVDTSNDHLAWMCRTALEHLGEHPLDKTARWEGYVSGMLSCKGITDAAAERRHARETLADSRAGRTEPNPPLAEAHRDLFARYLVTCGANPRRGRGLTGTDALARTCRAGLLLVGVLPYDILSLRLGFVQGCLTWHGLADVRTERDHSRPLFHAAYAKTGRIPATLERA